MRTPPLSKSIAYLLLAVALFSVEIVGGEEPIRENGISAHAFPKRVAEVAGKPWGLEIAYSPRLQPEPAPPFLQSIGEVLDYIRKQSPEVRQNGLWVVTTHPSAYTEEELNFHAQLKERVPMEGIPLFWARGADLDKGFKRF